MCDKSVSISLYKIVFIDQFIIYVYCWRKWTKTTTENPLQKINDKTSTITKNCWNDALLFTTSKQEKHLFLTYHTMPNL